MSGFSDAYTVPVIDANLISGALKFNRFLAWVLIGGCNTHNRQAKPAGWNKRSGPTQRERDIKVRSVIDVHLESPFVSEPLSHEGFFSCFRYPDC